MNDFDFGIICGKCKTRSSFYGWETPILNEFKCPECGVRIRKIFNSPEVIKDHKGDLMLIPGSTKIVEISDNEKCVKPHIIKFKK